MSYKPKLLNTVWIMKLGNGMFYPIQPSEACKPEDHGNLNKDVMTIEDAEGKVIWARTSSLL